MNFNIDHLKAGFRIRRECWPEKKWIFLAHSRDLAGPQLQRHEHLRKLLNKDPDLTGVVLPFIVMRDGDGRITMGWMIGQIDLLADDWVVKHGDDL